MKSKYFMFIFFCIFIFFSNINSCYPLTTKTLSKNKLTIKTKENLWIGRICPGLDEKEFFALGYIDNYYEIFSIKNNEIKSFFKTKILILEVENPYFQLANIKYFNLVDNRIIACIQSKEGKFSVEVVTIDKKNEGKIIAHTEKNFNVPIYFDEKNTFFSLKKEANNSLLIEKFDTLDLKEYKEKSAEKSLLAYNVISNNDFFYISFPDFNSEEPKSQLIKVSENGKIYKNSIMNGLITKMLKIKDDIFLTVNSDDNPNSPSKCFLLSKDLQLIDSYDGPSFYELNRFQGNLSILPNGTLINIKRIRKDKPENDSIQLYDIKNSLSLPFLESDSKNDEKFHEIINIISSSSQSGLIIGTMEISHKGADNEWLFNIFEIEN